jgi:hypothetical protein
LALQLPQAREWPWQQAQRLLLVQTQAARQWSLVQEQIHHTHQAQSQSARERIVTISN